MKMLSGIALVVLLAALVGSKPPTSPAESAGAPEEKKAVRGPRYPLEAVGRTECVPGRKALIAPVPLHPVEEVFVRPGDRVKKGQKLVKLDDDEPRADVRAKAANLESAQVSLKEARRLAQAVEETYREGSIPATTYFATRAALLKAEQDERAAKAALDSAKAELEHYLVVAMGDGVVAWLDVHPGMVSRPGTSTWGEILDLSEIDARCGLTAEQADRVAVGQAAAVRPKWGKAAVAGKVVFVGIATDKASGLVPVVVRVSNRRDHLRCGVPVQVRFTEARAAGEKD